MLEGVEEDGHGPDVHGVGPDAEEVRRNTGQLATNNPDGLAARRQLPPHEFFHRQGIGHVVGQRGKVIKPVRVGHELVVLHVLCDLLVATMQVADIGVRLGDDLTVEFEHDAQHAVSRRVGWTHVDGQGLPEQFAVAACFVLRREGAGGGIG